MQQVTVTKWTLHEGKPSTGLQYSVMFDRAVGVKKIVSVTAVEHGKSGGIDVTDQLQKDLNLDAVIETITDWDQACGDQAEPFPHFSLAKRAMQYSSIH